jgi:hypothetical protein
MTDTRSLVGDLLDVKVVIAVNDRLLFISTIANRLV